MPPIKRTIASTPANHQNTEQFHIVWIPRSKINLWKDNPRKNKLAVPKVATLIRNNKLRSPINLWDKDMVVYKGNTTLQALDLIKAEPRDTDKIKLIGDYLVPCILHNFASAHEAESYGVGDNKASEYAEWDEDMLAKILSSKGIKPLIGNTGFTQKEVSNLLWEPDAARMESIEPTDTGMFASIKIVCRPEDKEAILEVLKEWAKDSGFEGLALK